LTHPLGLAVRGPVFPWKGASIVLSCLQLQSLGYSISQVCLGERGELGGKRGRGERQGRGGGEGLENLEMFERQPM